MTAVGDLQQLAIDLDTLFVMTKSGRIARVNSPDGEPGPRVVLAGCRRGNVVRVRHDVGEETARHIIALAKDQPAWFDSDQSPSCLAAIVSRLSREAPVATVTPGVIYTLPHGLSCAAPGVIVSSDDAEGRRLWRRLAGEGMPQPLRDAGFMAPADLWPPWCMALEGGEIAATAFAARLGERGAEVGVYTFPSFRGRGFAAAVTARWSSLAELRGRCLFYSTQTTNRVSQRVAARLRLSSLGATLSVS